jgi:hypothetical protein
MDILIIGNGFDLAHGLPTNYKDFLMFINVLKQSLDENNQELKWDNINPQIKEMLESNIKNNLNFQKNKWESLINNNFWIDYFLQWNIYDKETWVDFETEIGNVVKIIDKDLEKRRLEDSFNGCGNTFVNDYFSSSKQYKKLEQEQLEKLFNNPKIQQMTIGKQSEFIQNYKENNPIKTTIQEITYHQLIKRLDDDLNKLIRALEIYLAEYVEKMQIDLVSKDFKNLKFDHILSFNYTHTYEKLYRELYTNENKKPIYDYIHGEANADNDIESNNMVLGIDEYLDDDKKNKNLKFISFKKYYQRIYKGTDSSYKLWVDLIRESENNTKSKLREEFPTQVPYKQFKNQHALYVFGHSLDVTDKDILRDLILNDSVYTTIYYKDKKTMGKQISNLVKVIGQDELIRRTGDSTKTIEFRMQQDMIQIENK